MHHREGGNMTDGPTLTRNLEQTGADLPALVRDVARTGKRILIEVEGVPVAALISRDDLVLLEEVRAEDRRDQAALDAFRAAFADVDAAELQTEIDKAIQAGRQENRERERAHRTGA